jgi:hypothetical protein
VHATVHYFHRRVADETPGWSADLAARLYGEDRPSGFCVLAEFGGREGAALSYWPTREAATRAALRSIDGAAMPLDVTVYDVVDSDAGTAAGEPAAVAQLTVFDGPRSRAQADAADRAGRERLWPAVQDLPGLVGVHVLRDADNGVVVVTLATSVEVLEAGQRAVLTTELLPGEDPALLGEPDRVQVHRVLAADLPAIAMAGERA